MAWVVLYDTLAELVYKTKERVLKKYLNIVVRSGAVVTQITGLAVYTQISSQQVVYQESETSVHMCELKSVLNNQNLISFNPVI